MLAVCTMRGPCVRLLSGPNRPAHRLHQDPAIRTQGGATQPLGRHQRGLFPSRLGVAQITFIYDDIAYSGVAILHNLVLRIDIGVANI